MKKSLFFLLAVLAVPVFAQEGVAINLNVGNFGIGSNLPGRDMYRVEGYASLVNVGVEHRATNIGIEFSPFKSFFWGRENESDAEGKNVFSFLNFNLYWNIINYDFGGIIYFGPFTSINYLFFDDENFYQDRYVFTAGLQVGFRVNMGGINYNLLSVETGYRRIGEENRYYVGGKIDIVALFLSIILLNSSGRR